MYRCKKAIAIFLILLQINLPTAFCEPAQKNEDQLINRYYTVIYNHISRTNASLSPEWRDWLTRAYIAFASEQGVDPLLWTAVAYAESTHNPYPPDSKAGAIGPAQLMPDTAAEIGIYGDSIRDPAQNIRGGTRYLRRMIDTFRYSGEWTLTLAVAAYNAGPEAIKKYGGLPPYEETIYYVTKIGQVYQRLIQDFNSVN